MCDCILFDFMKQSRQKKSHKLTTIVMIHENLLKTEVKTFLKINCKKFIRMYLLRKYKKEKKSLWLYGRF